MPGVVGRVVKNTGWLYAKMAITMFVSLYTTKLILKSLGVADFGIYSIVGGTIGMLGFLNSSMAAATQRFMSYVEGQRDYEKKKNIFNVSLFIHICLATIIALVLSIAGFIWFSGILNIPSDRIMAAYVIYVCMVISTLFTIVNVPYDAIMNSHENMKYYAFVGILESALKLSVAFCCVYSTHDKLIVYGVLMASIPVITLTIMKIYCHRHYEECIISMRKYVNKRVLKEMMAFASWNLFGNASAIVGNYGCSIVLNHFYGASLNAAMGIANQLNGQLLVFSNNMLKALNPVITKSEGAGERNKMLDLANTGSKFSFALFAVFAIPAILEMPFLQQLWLDNIPEWAVLFTQLQIVRTLTEQLTISYDSAISAEGRIKKYQLFISIINLMPVCLLIVLFSLGYPPVFMYVLNISIFGLLLDMVKVYFIHKNCRMQYSRFYKELFVPIILSFSIAFVLTYYVQTLMQTGWFRLIIVTYTGIVSFCICFWFISMKSSERKIIYHLVNNIVRKIR